MKTFTFEYIQNFIKNIEPQKIENQKIFVVYKQHEKIDIIYSQSIKSLLYLKNVDLINILDPDISNLSHMNLWLKMIKENINIAIILELSENFEEKLESILKELPLDLDFMYIFVNPKKYNIQNADKWGKVGCMLNKKSAKILFNITKNMNEISPFINKTKEYSYMEQLNNFKDKLNKEKWVIYTVNIGNYDENKFFLNNESLEKLKNYGIDVIYFTDDKKYTNNKCIVKYVDIKWNSSVRTARYIKIMAYKFLPKYDISIFSDSNQHINNIDIFLNMVIDKLNTNIILKPHPNRKCIYEERDAIVKYKKCSRNIVDKQMDRYKKDNFPSIQFGLNETGIIVRRHNSIDVIDFSNIWFNEVMNGSHRDQLSCNYSIWKSKISVSLFNYNEIKKLFTYSKHTTLFNNQYKKENKIYVDYALINNINITQIIYNLLENVDNHFLYIKDLVDILNKNNIKLKNNNNLSLKIINNDKTKTKSIYIDFNCDQLITVEFDITQFVQVEKYQKFVDKKINNYTGGLIPYTCYKKSLVSNKKVSILMSLYNKEKYVINSIKSVLNQTNKDWELIIINDCSTDKSYNVVKDYISRYNQYDIRLYNMNKNYGPYVCLNLGINLSKGEYICRLDSDDILHKDNISITLDTFKNNPEYDVVKYRNRKNKKLRYSDISLFYRKSIINKIGYYDSVRYAADTEFNDRIGLSKIKIAQIDDVLYTVIVTPNSLTTSESTKYNSPERVKYVENYLKWHNKNTNHYIDFPLKNRHFDTPEKMIITYP